jgi:hypothetical protein
MPFPQPQRRTEPRYSERARRQIFAASLSPTAAARPLNLYCFGLVDWIAVFLIRAEARNPRFNYLSIPFTTCP